MPLKEFLSAVAVLITFVAYYPYLRSVLKNDIIPHYFSWVIWGITTFVVFLAQLSDDGGAGAWPIGFSGVITIFIAFLAYRKRERVGTTTSDWLFLCFALLSLPLWYVTSNPLWAVVILTTIDALGFGPTIRKTYADPHSEPILFYGIFAGRNVIAIVALENYSLTTMLFPVVTGLGCMLLVGIMAYRRALLR